MNVLVVVAHPDDEVLGLGGTLLKHTLQGDSVHVLSLTNGEDSRESCHHEVIEQRQKAFQKSCKLLKAKKYTMMDLPDQGLDTVPLVAVTKAIESYADPIKPDIVYCHHSGDLNKDHQIVHSACITAFRPTGEHYPGKILAFETPSSTEWGDLKASFTPNYFVNISSTIENKLKLLTCYDTEMRPYPHPRSYKGIEIAAQRWGTVIGATYAEAFCLIREVKN